tara:strand:- start:572 stop:1366 length:795 start_codon:yes stop_codon:yes gene_type:complete
LGGASGSILADDDEDYRDIERFTDPNHEKYQTILEGTALDNGIVSHQDYHWFTPRLPQAIRQASAEDRLIWAAHNGHTHVAREALQDGADVHGAMNDLGQTAMQIAMANENDNIILLLIEGGANTHTVYNGIPLFHWVALQGKTHLMDWLQRKGVSVDTPDAHGNTVLHILAQGELTEATRRAINWLRQQGARFDATNHEGQTPSQVAEAAGNFTMAQILRQHETLLANDPQGLQMVVGPHGVEVVPHWVLTQATLSLILESFL